MYIPRDELIASCRLAWEEYLLMRETFGKTRPMTQTHASTFRDAYRLCSIAHITLEDLDLPPTLPPMASMCYTNGYDPLEGGLTP